MWRLALGVALSAAGVNGVNLRSSGVPVTHGMEKPAAKVRHLILDIEESIRKAGEDAEMVFATLYTYDGQLENSLKREVGTLNQTLAKLVKMQQTYAADMNKSHTKLEHLGASAEGSQKMATKYQTGTVQTRGRFNSLEQNVKMLISLLRSSGVTPQGTLVTPETPDANGEPARVYTAIRRLLFANKGLRSTYANVYRAFLPQSSPEAVKQQPVRMSQSLLTETIGALTAVEQRLSGMKSEALLQFDSLHRRFEKEAVFAGASAQAQQGLEAENEQKAQELMFSIKFTTSVLKIDQEFQKSVLTHVKSNADLIYGIRDLRQAQLKVLRDLTGILGAEGAIASGGLSFLETKSERTSESSDMSQGSTVGLQSEIERTIHNNGDTHAILMRIKAQLDESQPIDAGSVRSTMVEIQNVLKSVEEDQSKSDEARRGCESQKFHAGEEEQSLKANLALMSAARDHAEKAIKAAQTNVKGIEKKNQALDKSSKDFSRISAQAIKSLESQSHDRQTIMLAVKKAAEVVGPTLPAGGSTVDLLQSLLQDLQGQDQKEKAYRTQQDAFRSDFLHYVQDYAQLLGERSRHYESTLGVLDLHVSELASDLLAQQQTLSTGAELRRQSEGLCESVLKFYDQHTKQRAQLSKTLRAILPNMPTVLSAGAIANADLD